MHHSWYHKSLRVGAALTALMLIFVSGIISPYTAELAKHTSSYLANAVGVSVGVEPNELNVITAQLTQRERDLAEREAALTQREINVGIDRSSGAVSGVDYSNYILSSILFILLLLILLNYALDFRRNRESEQIQYANNTPQRHA